MRTVSKERRLKELDEERRRIQRDVDYMASELREREEDLESVDNEIAEVSQWPDHEEPLPNHLGMTYPDSNAGVVLCTEHLTCARCEMELERKTTTTST